MRSKTIESIRLIPEEASRVQPSGRLLVWNGTGYKNL